MASTLAVPEPQAKPKVSQIECLSCGEKFGNIQDTVAHTEQCASIPQSPVSVNLEFAPDEIDIDDAIRLISEYPQQVAELMAEYLDQIKT